MRLVISILYLYYYVVNIGSYNKLESFVSIKYSMVKIRYIIGSFGMLRVSLDDCLPYYIDHLEKITCDI